jgi:hypothetical protein
VKHYTYTVICSFSMQYTFTEDEVEEAEGGESGDFEPTEKAMIELQYELNEYLGNSYPISDLTVETEFDALLGINDMDDEGNISE